MPLARVATCEPCLTTCRPPCTAGAPWRLWRALRRYARRQQAPWGARCPSRRCARLRLRAVVSLSVRHIPSRMRTPGVFAASLGACSRVVAALANVQAVLARREHVLARKLNRKRVRALHQERARGLSVCVCGAALKDRAPCRTPSTPSAAERWMQGARMSIFSKLSNSLSCTARTFSRTPPRSNSAA